MQTMFWRWAFRRYRSRVPSQRLERYAIWWGAVLTLLFAVAVIFANGARLLVATMILLIGLAHRRIRLEQQKGPNALYLKTRSARE